MLNFIYSILDFFKIYIQKPAQHFGHFQVIMTKVRFIITEVRDYSSSLETVAIKI